MTDTPITDQPNRAAAILKMATETVHTGRFMINVGLDDVSKRQFTNMLATIPSENVAALAETKGQNPRALCILTIVEIPFNTSFRVGCQIYRPSIMLDPEVAATMIQNQSSLPNDAPVGALAQLEWLSDWASKDGLRVLSNDPAIRDEERPSTEVNLLRGLFRDTDIVVLFNVLDPRSHSMYFHTAIEARVTSDGALVPTF